MGVRAPTVLFVEDNDIFRGIVTHGLRDSGLRVEVAARGDDALAKLKELRPDLILMDLALPQVNGLALLNHIRAEATLSGVPVIVLSAHCGRSMEAEAARRGAAHFVGKTDVGLAGIVRLVHDVLNGTAVA